MCNLGANFATSCHQVSNMLKTRCNLAVKKIAGGRRGKSYIKIACVNGFCKHIVFPLK